MNRSGKILVLGGLALALFGMLFGLYYAVFIEHQALDGMGSALTNAFVQVAQRQISQANVSLDAYGRIRYDYVRQVDVHSHWIGLGMLMIVLGAVFARIAFSEPVRCWLAIALLAGSIIFPLGVILQTATPSKVFGSALAIGGSALVTVALAGVAVGFIRQQDEGNAHH